MSAAHTIGETALVLTDAQKDLVVQVLAAIETRLDDYVESGTLSWREADLLGELVESLQDADQSVALAADARTLIKHIADAEPWPELLGWSEAETNAWAALRGALDG